MAKPTTGQYAELFKQVDADRVTRKNLQAFLDDPDALLGKGSKKPSPSKPGICTVTIDYGKTLAEMIAAGRYDYADNDITATNFPFTETGVVTVEIELVNLGRNISTDPVLKHLDEQKQRPVTLPELLALGAKYPDLQRQFPLIALGSSWVAPSGDRDVPCLFRDESDQHLFLYWGGLGWSESCRFPVVRK